MFADFSDRAAVSSLHTSEAAGGILLVEEYEALALAIELVLRKFAPEFAITRCADAGQAWELARRQQPRLLVVDHDPPAAALIGFFQNLRELAPDTRLLLIASTSRRGQLTEFRQIGSLHFVEKPFDLQQLGEAVQSLLAPIALKTLRDFGVSDCVALSCLTAASLRLTVNSGGEKVGEIDVMRGQISNAETRREKGEEALLELLSMPDALCHESKPPSDGLRSLKGDWIDLLARVSKKVAPDLARRERAKPAVTDLPSSESQAGSASHQPVVKSREHSEPQQPLSFLKQENGAAGVALASETAAHIGVIRGVAARATPSSISPPLVTRSATSGFLELSLEVLAVEFTANLKIGILRAQLTEDGLATLRIPSDSGGAAPIVETGFELGEIDLDPSGQMGALRLRPTRRPSAATSSNRKLTVSSIALAPEEQRWRLFSTTSPSLKLQLTLPVELVAVSLSPEVDVSELTMRCQGTWMSATLHSALGGAEGGAKFRAVEIQLDKARRMQEMALAPMS